MAWIVEFHQEFEREAGVLNKNVQKGLAVSIRFLEEFGPTLGRPYADKLKESKHTNMKELRFVADDGVWRVAFAFDPERKAILLIAGNKSGVNERRFYKQLIKKADARFDNHLAEIEGEKKL